MPIGCMSFPLVMDETEAVALISFCLPGFVGNVLFWEEVISISAQFRPGAWVGVLFLSLKDNAQTHTPPKQAHPLFLKTM